MGIDPGYSADRATTGVVVLALDADGAVTGVAEHRHCTTTQLRDEVLPRLLEEFAPRLAAIDAPLMDRFTELSPFGATKCRPQEMVSMQSAFTRCRLKAGHAFTPRGLALHAAGQDVADHLLARGFVFDLFSRIGSLCATAWAGGPPVVVEAFPKLWLGLQLPVPHLTGNSLPEQSHDRDAAMLRALLRVGAFVDRFGLDDSVNDFRIIANADELAAATSALGGVMALTGSAPTSGGVNPAVALGSPRGGHFLLPPRSAWHADHVGPLENAVRAVNDRTVFDECTLLELV